MSESMTVEHATELAKKFAALARANEDLCKHAIKQRDALQARVAELEVWERFVPYLIDNHEKEVVYEESIQRWLAEMLDKEKANQIEGGA